MAFYYVNKNAQDNGDHEVHKSDCLFIPLPTNRLSLGSHASCKSAVREAKKYYPQSNGCYFCSKECHTS